MAKHLTIEIPYCPQEYQLNIHEAKERFRVIVIGRRGGKTELAINEIIKKSVENPGRYWFIAPSYKQSKSIVWDRFKHLVEPDKNWKFNEVDLSARHKITKSLIELKGADNEENLRGAGLSGAVLDECAIIKANVWPEIIRPMLADKQGWTLFISTPKGKNWFFDLYADAVRGKEGWKSWKFPSTINKYLAASEIEAARKDMSERLFRQEFMAEFLDDETSVFKGVRRCITGEYKTPVLGRMYIMGADLAKSYDYTVLVVMDAVTREVVYFERFQDVLWREQKNRIQKIATKYNNALLYIDATGVGDPIVEDLSISGVSTEGIKFTNESKTKIIEQLAIAIEQRLITFPREEVLINELMQYEYQLTTNGRIKYSAPEGKHDDCVIALALAVWGMRASINASQATQYQHQQADELDRQGHGERIYEENTNYSGY